MPEYLTPGVYFEFVDESRRGIAALRTDVAAFIGIAERGPLHTPTRVTSWQQFQSIFGNFISNGFLAYEVKSFFENGGRACYIVHVAAPLAETDTNLAAIQPLDRRSSIVNTIDGFAKGTVVTATQTRATQTSAVPQPIDRSSSLVNDVGGFPQGSLVKVTQSGLITYRHVKAIDAVTKQLFWDEPLDSLYNLALPILFETLHQVDLMLNDVSAATLMWDTPLPAYFDLTQTLHLATGNAAANGDLLDENNEATLRVEAIDPGAWGNAVAVRVTRSTSIATRTADMPQPADHSLSVVESVTGLMIGTLVKVFQAGVANAEYRVVTKVDPTRRTIVWDAALNPAYYDLVDATKLNAPLSIETIEFALSVYLAGQLREVFSGLSLIKDHARYVMKVIAGSNSSLIRVIDLHPTSISDLAIPPFPFPMRLPNPEAANLTRGRLRLRGGRDGIAALKPHDFTGSSSDVTKRGLRTLEEVDEVAIVAMPDILIKPVLPPQKLVRPAPEPIECPVPIGPPIEAEPYTPPMIERAPDFSPDQILSAQQALILHCETLRDRIALIDPPSVSHSELIDAREIQSWRQQFDSSYAALYFPWVLVYDPLN